MGNMKNYLNGMKLIDEWCKSNRLQYSIDDPGNLLFTVNGRDGNTRYLFIVGTQETDVGTQETNQTFSEYIDYYSYDLYTLDEQGGYETFLGRSSASTMGELMKMISSTLENNTDYKDFPTYVDSTDEDYGEWIEEYHKRYKYYCSNCGSGSDRNGKFCDYCGIPMRNSARSKPY